MKEEWWRKPSTWKSNAPNPGTESGAVNGVSYTDAVGFCKWKTKAYRIPNKPMNLYTLPSVPEWEAALVHGWKPTHADKTGDWCTIPKDPKRALLILPGEPPKKSRAHPRFARDETTGFRLVIHFFD